MENFYDNKEISNMIIIEISNMDIASSVVFTFKNTFHSITSNRSSKICTCFEIEKS